MAQELVPEGRADYWAARGDVSAVGAGDVWSSRGGCENTGCLCVVPDGGAVNERQAHRADPSHRGWRSSTADTVCVCACARVAPLAPPSLHTVLSSPRASLLGRSGSHLSGTPASQDLHLWVPDSLLLFPPSHPRALHGHRGCRPSGEFGGYCWAGVEG